MAPSERPSQKRPPLEASNHVNVAQAERIASLLGGGLLAFWGLRRFSTFRMLAVAAAGGLGYRGITGHSFLYDALGLNTAIPGRNASALTIEESLTIYRPRNDVYEFWRDVTNLPRFMRHLASVRDLGEGRSEWTARLPKDVGTITWKAERTEDTAGERIAWQSLPGADVHNSGSVRFKDLPGGREGTELHVTIAYRPPAGEIGQLVASLLNPTNRQMIKEDVRRCKSLLEAGEVPTVEGQPAGQRGASLLKTLIPG